MIVDVISDDILNSSCKHVVFAIKTEGINSNMGFCKEFCEHVLSCFSVGPKTIGKLGDVVSIVPKTDTKYYGIVCYSQEWGWDSVAEAVKNGLDKLQVPENETIAVAMLETGFIGYVSGHNARKILEAIHASNKQCIVYSFKYNKEEIFSLKILSQ
jgi:hypothetical protein